MPCACHPFELTNCAAIVDRREGPFLVSVVLKLRHRYHVAWPALEMHSRPSRSAGPPRPLNNGETEHNAEEMEHGVRHHCGPASCCAQVAGRIPADPTAGKLKASHSFSTQLAKDPKGMSCVMKVLARIHAMARTRVEIMVESACHHPAT